MNWQCSQVEDIRIADNRSSALFLYHELAEDISIANRTEQKQCPPFCIMNWQCSQAEDISIADRIEAVPSFLYYELAEDISIANRTEQKQCPLFVL